MLRSRGKRCSGCSSHDRCRAVQEACLAGPGTSCRPRPRWVPISPFTAQRLPRSRACGIPAQAPGFVSRARRNASCGNLPLKPVSSVLAPLDMDKILGAKKEEPNTAGTSAERTQVAMGRFATTCIQPGRLALCQVLRPDDRFGRFSGVDDRPVLGVHRGNNFAST